MARSNPFAKKKNKEKIQIESHQIVSTQETADGLPVFETPTCNVEIPFKDNKGNPQILKLDTITKIDPSKLSIKAKKGKTFIPWFHDLFQHSQTDAVLLVRIYLEIRRNEGSATQKNAAFRELSNYLINTPKRLTSVTYRDFSEIGLALNRLNYSPQFAGLTINLLKRIIEHAPSISDQIKEQIKAYVRPKNIGNRVVKTANERIQNSKVNNDYSDYVMFQIYAYTNACLLEIKETQERLSALLKESESPHLLTEEGVKHYKLLIISGTEHDYEQALSMELIAQHRINQAQIALHLKVKSGWDIKLTKELLTQCKYQEALDKLPADLKNNKDVVYLFMSALKNGIKDNKKTIQLILKNIGSKKQLSIHAIIHNRMNHNRDMWHIFKQYIAFRSILYQAFYGDRKNSHTPVDNKNSYHNVVLGLTSHFDFLVINLLICETGKNREVAFNLPAFVNLGKYTTSVLDVESQFSSEPSCWLSSFKTRGHVNNGGGSQEEDMVVPLNTPLFSYLKLLDSLRQQSHPDRELFFQVLKPSFSRYASLFPTHLKIRQANGDKVLGLISKKYRKVWTGEVLLEYLDGIQNKDDLIKAIGEDLRNTIPLTYLLQSSKTETMLASAIVGLQVRFIDHHLELAAQIKLEGEKPTGKREKRFFCDCSDPYTPDYAPDLHIEYCRQFDMCLGCSKAVIYEEHLPNIIYRCFQYEDILKRSRNLYMAHYETKHQRAKQALERFKAKAVSGEEKHAFAFKQAANAWGEPNLHFLPPLIHPNINHSNIIPFIQGGK
tara:strand:- start:24076 stop:26412 length:2337 start_codon:yes stop_codon:yes gene_type:complete